ncbi:hypothetical protein BH09ACT6_BH09ACT6_08510 [soil metagenome]
MGGFSYGGSEPTVQLDDRSLAHLQIVITAKLRRHESFLLTWVNSAADGGGRNSIWLDPSSTLYFHFSRVEPQQINREWVARLMASADSPSGLFFGAEPNAEHPSRSPAAAPDMWSLPDD